MSRDLIFDGAFEHLYVMTQSTVSAWCQPGGRGGWEGPLGNRGPDVGEPLGGTFREPGP